MTVIDLLKVRLDRDDAEPLSAGGTGDSNAASAPAALSRTEPAGRDAPITEVGSANPQQVVTQANDRLKERQCDLLFGHARLGGWGSVATALVVVSLLWSVTSHALLLRWIALFLLTGAVVAFSAHVRSIFAFSIPAILPYAAYLLLVGNIPMVVLGGALLTFLGFVTSIALNEQNDFLRHFATEQENTRLATQLAAQKHVTQTLNAVLETRVRQRRAELKHEIIERQKEIEARKNTENRLRLSEEIVDTSLDLNSVVDKNYRYLTVNTGYVQAFGETKESFIGKCVADLAGMDVFENQLKPLIDRALQGESLVSEYWLEYPNHGKRYMEARYEPYRDRGRRHHQRT